MPTIEEGNILVFNTETLKLYLGDTEIATTTDNTGTLLTFASTPNSDYQIPINNVEGDVVTTSSNSDNTKSNTVTFPLQEGQKMYLGSYLAEDGTHHTRWQDVIDGSKNITWVNTYHYFQITVTKRKIKWHNPKANLFSTTKYNGLSLEGSNDNTNFWLFDENYFFEKDSNKLKTFLKENPLIVEYDLLNEYVEPYTPEQRQAYKKLLKMQSYYDVTNISGSSDNLQPIITAEALKSMKALSKYSYSYDSTTYTLTITEG